MGLVGTVNPLNNEVGCEFFGGKEWISDETVLLECQFPLSCLRQGIHFMDFAPYMALLWTGLHLKCRGSGQLC